VPDVERSLRRLPPLIAGLCLLADAALIVQGEPSVGRPGWWAVLVAVVLADTALAAPASASLPVAAAHAALPVLSGLLLDGSFLLGAGALVAAYRAGAWLLLPAALTALGLLIAGTVVTLAVVVPGPRGPDGPDIVLACLVNATLPWLVGRYTTARQTHLDALERRAAVAAADERAAVQQAVAREREAIARDLHDVISHHVSAIAVHAAAARLRLPEDSPLRTPVLAVESAGRAAAIDLHRLLDLLHGAEPAPHRPGLADVGDLLDRVRTAGLAAEVDVAPDVGPLPESVDVAVYRVVQEALTNALRHGAPGPVTVAVHRTARPAADEVEVVVVNAVRSRAPVPADAGRGLDGRGLDGLRARVALLGGRLSAGLRPGGREWELRAVLPLEAGS
jgi:signal transduction histidine kinase